MAGKVYVGDIGTLVRVNCGSDITGATTHEVHIKKPDQTEHIWAATIFGTNYLEHIATAADFNQKGVYYGHAYVILPSGVWRGELFSFTVYQKWS